MKAVRQDGTARRPSFFDMMEPERPKVDVRLRDPPRDPPGVRAGGGGGGLRGLCGDGGRDVGRCLLASFPGPGHHLGDALSGMVGELGEDVGEPGARIDVIELAGLDQGIDGCGAAAPRVRAGEGPIAAPDRSRTVILPISGRTSKFVTDGTRFRGGVFAATTRSGAPGASSSTSRRRRAWSSWWRRGCSIRQRAPE